VLAPFYLQAMIGQIVDIKMLTIMRTILMVVFIPLLLGAVTTNRLKKRFEPQVVNKKIKPALQPISLWAMLYVIFAPIRMRAAMIIKNWEMIGLSAVVLILFYLILFTMFTWIAKRLFSMEDALSFIYGTTLRKLSIAMGVGVTSFGMEAALLITIAFMVQQQGVVLYNRFIVQRHFQEKSNLAH